MHQKGGTYYYVTSGTPRVWTKLERDYAIAIRLYAEIEGTSYPEHVATFRTIAARYRREVFPTKAFQTQRDNEKEMVNLEAVFGDLPISSIKPHHVRRYLDIRGLKAKVRANREKTLLSHLFNHARQWGYTDAANPCAGVKGHKETERDRYVDDNEFRAIWEKADFTVQDAMDILYCTAQRPSDVLRMKHSDIRNGELWIRQGKGGQKIRIEIGGVLEAVIERILARPYPAKPNSIVLGHSEARANGALIQNEDGQPLSYGSYDIASIKHARRQRLVFSFATSGQNRRAILKICPTLKSCLLTNGALPLSIMRDGGRVSVSPRSIVSLIRKTPTRR